MTHIFIKRNKQAVDIFFLNKLDATYLVVNETELSTSE